jgi:16S rRNA (adenine1518-N6/adenine1519-N6)-dimethyltransferase
MSRGHPSERSRPAAAAAEAGGYGRPKRALGQNFLVDSNVAAKIVATLGIVPGETVIEIGPGRGALSGPILDAKPGAYLALEKDRDLAARLVGEHPGAAVANIDALRLDWSRLDRLPGARLVGNLPYNIASPLLWDLCAGASRFARGVFMVQHEVARRLAAGPGGREYGALTAWIGNFVVVRYCFKVPPTVFRPRPKVDSAVVAVTPLPPGDRAEDPAGLARLLKILFAARRKQLGGILRRFGDESVEAFLQSRGLTLRDRPENMAPIALRDLAKLLKTRLAS